MPSVVQDEHEQASGPECIGRHVVGCLGKGARRVPSRRGHLRLCRHVLTRARGSNGRYVASAPLILPSMKRLAIVNHISPICARSILRLSRAARKHSGCHAILLTVAARRGRGRVPLRRDRHPPSRPSKSRPSRHIA